MGEQGYPTAMRAVVRTSSPLNALAERARDFSSHCEELWVATAFVSDSAVHDVIETALDAASKVRFITGTFGRVTRKRTFQYLHQIAGSASLRCRIWDGDFHAKLFIWRTGSRAVAWIGSANLTDRGLQEEGELMLEVSERWDSPVIRSLRRAYQVEWARASTLDQEFLRGYREAPRPAGFLQGKSHAPKSRPLKRRTRARRVMLSLAITRHYPENSSTLKRIAAQLGGTAENWYRSSSPRIRELRRGHYCLFVDEIDNDVTVGVVTDTAKDGRGRVIAYESFAKTLPSRPLKKPLRSKLQRIGLKPTKKAFRMGWLDSASATKVVASIYGTGAALKFRKSMRQSASKARSDTIASTR
jgi:HKD family nuclease